MSNKIGRFVLKVNIFNSVTTNTPKAEGRPAIIYTILLMNLTA